MAIGRRDLVQEIGRVFFGRFAMAAQRAVRKLLLAVVALYLLFLISVWHVVNRSSARSIAYGAAAWFVSAPQPAARRLEPTPHGRAQGADGSPLRAAARRRARRRRR